MKFMLGLLAGFTFSSSASAVFDLSSRESMYSTGSYVSVVVRNGRYEIFSTSQDRDGYCPGRSCPGIVLRRGSGATPQIVFPNNRINDSFVRVNGQQTTQLHPQRFISRLVVRFDTQDKRYYAMAHVSGGYNTGSVEPNKEIHPAFLRSACYRNSNNVLRCDDPTRWEYVGKLGGEVGKEIGGRVVRGSSMSLIVNPYWDGGAVNHRNPFKNKFVFHTDMSYAGIVRTNILYSNDGKNWYTFMRDGVAFNWQPYGYRGEKWNFASAVATPKGYFMAVTIGWPPQGFRILYSPNGYGWKYIATVRANKNISLGYNHETNNLLVIPTLDDSSTASGYESYYKDGMYRIPVRCDKISAVCNHPGNIAVVHGGSSYAASTPTVVHEESELTEVQSSDGSTYSGSDAYLQSYSENADIP